MQRAFHAFLLAFALLFAQGGMAAHAISHMAHASHAGDEGVPQDSASDLCVGYAQLSGSAPLQVQALQPECLARHEAPQIHFSAFVSRTVSQSRARDPPAFS